MGKQIEIFNFDKEKVVIETKLSVTEFTAMLTNPNFKNEVKKKFSSKSKNK